MLETAQIHVLGDASRNYDKLDHGRSRRERCTDIISCARAAMRCDTLARRVKQKKFRGVEKEGGRENGGVVWVEQVELPAFHLGVESGKLRSTHRCKDSWRTKFLAMHSCLNLKSAKEARNLLRTTTQNLCREMCLGWIYGLSGVR